MAMRSAEEAIAWLQDQGIRRVEVVFADLTSVARGKTMDVASFVQTLGARLPTLLLGLTVTGGESLQELQHFLPTILRKHQHLSWPLLKF